MMITWLGRQMLKQINELLCFGSRRGETAIRTQITKRFVMVMAGMTLYGVLPIAIVTSPTAAQADVVTLSEDFEDGVLDPRISVSTTGSFNSGPGIKNVSNVGSTKAFGFGLSTCGANCFFNYITVFSITLPAPAFVSTISFKEMELYGNWGSDGSMFVDGNPLGNGYRDFGRLPYNDGVADTIYRSRVFSINRTATTIDLRVADITRSSEIFIDDLEIRVNPSCDQRDEDSDGVLDDDDCSGVAGDNPCTGGNMSDCDDNCRTVSNADQLDVDGDGVGDVCDNCPSVANRDQRDTDGDGSGDACECLGVLCMALDQCHNAGECDPGSGLCSNPTVPDGTACGDDNACNGAETCHAGTCLTGTAPVCNDNNSCTDDSCDSATGCVQTNNTSSCNDGNACTTTDTCSDGICVGTPSDNVIRVDVYSGFNLAGGGAPYSGLVGTFTASGVSFATDTGYNWHPFGLASFGADITGFLQVTSEGLYSFTLNSDDGSLLFIDGTQVVNNGGVHAPRSMSGNATLTAGRHAFAIQFFECCAGPSGVDLALPVGVTFGQCPAGCGSDADCNDNDPCTDDRCELLTGCENTPIDNCCSDPSPVSCDELQPCDTLPADQICPPNTPVTSSTVLVEPADEAVCAGGILSVSVTRTGEITRTVTSLPEVCDGECFQDCFDDCVGVPLQECHNVCIRRCGNGACLQWETQCDFVDLALTCDLSCFTQCDSSFDPSTQTSTFTQPCGETIGGAVEIRESAGGCNGALVDARSISGAGTASVALAAPLVSGSYVVCYQGEVIKTVLITDCGPRCRIRLPANTFDLVPGVSSTFSVQLENVHTVGPYSISLHRFEDNAHTQPMAVPGFLSVPASVEVPEDGSALFEVNAADPQPFEGQYHWPNVMVRATGGETACESLFDVNVVVSACAGQPAGTPCGDPSDNACNRADSCDGEGQCLPNHAAQGTPCTDDGNLCTDDACDGSGVCGHAASTAACDDRNACTTDTCDPMSGCAHTTMICTDGDLCTNDSCNAVMGCVFSPLRCNDGNACTTDACDPKTGCTHTTIQCYDGDECTNDACNPGTGCIHTTIQCYDANNCTDDSCNPASGCTFSPVVCNDDSACTTNSCDPTSGCRFDSIRCSDENPCTDDSCNEATGCVYTQDDTNPCADGNACTADACVAGQCVSTPFACDDSNSCTDDACNAATGCVFTPNDGNRCTDGNACTADACAAGRCTGAPITCSDNNPCTDDTCNPATGCVFTPDDGNRCTDGNACTADACAAGGCTSSPVRCDDTNPCTDDECDPASGCRHIPDDTNECTDGNACTTDACVNARCLSRPIRCDDTNPCTDDTCNPATGCVNTPDNTNVCSDGNACTKEACVAGQCTSSPVKCDDGNPCTDDSCDSVGGCVYAPDNANVCSDGNQCTMDTCVAGRCSTLPVTCSDNNPCTDDSCNPATGCVYAPDDTNPCNDGNACTDDVCRAGRCVGTPLKCDDGNVCTTDACDPTRGCTHVCAPFPCHEGDLCSTDDTGATSPAGHVTVSFDASGNVIVLYEQSRDLNDNSYGRNIVNWPRSHSFSNLVGSDKARFVFRDARGNVVFDFYMDYITRKTGTPSGYASLGVAGGEGGVNAGQASWLMDWDTSLAASLNRTGYCAGGNCVVGGVDLLVNSPPTTPPNTSYNVNPAYSKWNFTNSYSVKVSRSAFGANGFGSVIINDVHNSPPKKGKKQVFPNPCEPCGGGNGPCPSDGDQCASVNSQPPGFVGHLTASVDAAGDVTVVYDQALDLNDNSYGTNIVNWPRSHSFRDLVGSDKAQFIFRDAAGRTVFDFFLDYISPKSGTPSGYASLGAAGGEGHVNSGQLSWLLAWDTSLDASLNDTGYCSGESCVVSGVDLLMNSPPTTPPNTSYTVAPAFSQWNFTNSYKVKVSHLAFGSSGFGRVEIGLVHNSPPKRGSNAVDPNPCTPCEPATGGTSPE